MPANTWSRRAREEDWTGPRTGVRRMRITTRISSKILKAIAPERAGASSTLVARATFISRRYPVLLAFDRRADLLRGYRKTTRASRINRDSLDRGVLKSIVRFKCCLPSEWFAFADTRRCFEGQNSQSNKHYFHGTLNLAERSFYEKFFEGR